MKKCRSIKFSFYENIRQWKLPQSVISISVKKNCKCPTGEGRKEENFLFPRKWTKSIKIPFMKVPIPNRQWTVLLDPAIREMPDGRLQCNHSRPMKWVVLVSRYFVFFFFFFLFSSVIRKFRSNMISLGIFKALYYPRHHLQDGAKDLLPHSRATGFHPLYQYLWHVGTRYAQWVNGRAGSVTLSPQMFSATLRANK